MEELKHRIEVEDLEKILDNLELSKRVLDKMLNQN